MNDNLTPKTVTYYDLIPLLEEMERQGFKHYRKVWREYICEWGATNDTIFYLGFKYYSHTEDEQEWKEYFSELNLLLGLDPANDGIMVKVSW